MERKGSNEKPYLRSGPKSIMQKLVVLFTQGGMMNVGYATLLGKEIPLLSPVTIMSNKTIHLYYNYFDDAFYDEIICSTRDNNFEAEVTGTKTFARVIRAGTLLYDSCPRSLDPDSQEEHGWINFLFGSQVSNPWKQYISAATDIESADIFDRIWTSEQTRQFLKGECLHPDLWENPRIDPEASKSDYMPKFVLRTVKAAIHAIHLSSGTHRDKIEFIVHSLQSNVFEATGKPPCYQQFITICDILPVECIIPLVNDEFQCDITHLLTPPLLRTFSIYEDAIPTHQNSISTSSFLNISDDDRVYFWRPDGDVVLSAQMITWLRNIKRMYEDIHCSSEHCAEYAESVWTFFCTLEKLNRDFDGLYCFKSFFMEYLNHACDRKYQAILRLLLRMMDQTTASMSDKSEHYSERKELKRYLAILGNPCLRGRIFGF